MSRFLEKLFNLFRQSEVSSEISEEKPETEPETDRAPRQPDIEITTGRPFEDLNLHPDVLKGVQAAGFSRCTEVQDKALPLTLAGQGIAAQAQTGSGKTAVFLLAIFEQYLKDKAAGKSFGQALILAPTRELALQIHRDAELLGQFCKLRYAVILGGVSYDAQIAALKENSEVVIATPGRLIDLMKQKLFKPEKVSILVVDEADRMLDMGFIRDLRYIFRRLRPYNQRQSMLFSATLSARVLELTYEHMNITEEISISPKELVVETVDQVLHHVARNEKIPLLLGLLQREKWERVLIFSNTKVEAVRVAMILAGNGYSCNAITGDLSQKQRISTLSRFMSGQVPILVATDVASRGLHVDDVSIVINYDVPQDREEYVHRIGRTARAGKTGKAITLASERDVYNLAPIEELLGQKLPVVWADEAWLVPDKSRRRPGPPPKKGRPRRPRKGKPKAQAADAGPKPAGKGRAGSSPRGGRRRRPSQRSRSGGGQKKAGSGN